MEQQFKSKWLVLVTILTGVVLFVIVAERGAPGSLLPHGYCFTWNPTLLWTHVISDGVIGAAYMSIPLTLLYLVRRRQDIPFDWILVLFAVFIVSCGASHWIEVWTVWRPDYWLLGSVKVVTAGASVLTAAALVRLVPDILSIPTIAELTAAKQALEVEVRQRREAEIALLRDRSGLEHRVRERTQQLEAVMRAAEAAHARAEESNRLKDRFLAKVSHELRTPLQSTLTWAQLLKRAAHDPHKAAQASERIMHNVRSQARLIDDLLDISRILSGKLRLELQQIDAAPVIEKAIEVVRSAFASRGINIEVVREGGSTVIDADPVRLEQVVWNLVNNAVQASKDGGRVQVRFGADGNQLRLEVRDWGRGIDSAELPHIFEPFRQVSGDGGSHRGLGLGLAIVRSIVEMSGGELKASSEGLGLGATFTFLLPLVALSAEPISSVYGAPLDADQQARLAGLRVLYVEDELDIAEGGQMMLSDLGASVDLCTSFEAASERLKRGAFDVLLSDLNLGHGHTAYELIALLRSFPWGAKIPALVLSAYGSAEDVTRSHEAGFMMHLVKPAEANAVARALLRATGRLTE